MGETKVTRMIIKGDLQCYKCRKKIKKTLCKIPQIRDQIYDEKNNKVMIIVVCCNPEKIRDKICSKACGSIESIEILEDKPKPPEKPKEPEKPKQPEKPKEPPPKPKEPEKPPPKPKEPEKPKEPPPKPKEPEKPKEPPPKPKEPEKPKEPPPKPKEPEKPKVPPPAPMPCPGYPPTVFYPVVCCPCCEGYGGPCYHGRPPMCPDGCGRPVYDCYGGNRSYYVSRCDYFNEENATGCTIM